MNESKSPVNISFFSGPVRRDTSGRREQEAVLYVACHDGDTVRPTRAGLILPDGTLLDVAWGLPACIGHGVGHVPIAALAEELKRRGYGGATGTIIVHAFLDDDGGNRYVSWDTYFDLTMLRLFRFP